MDRNKVLTKLQKATKSGRIPRTSPVLVGKIYIWDSFQFFLTQIFRPLGKILFPITKKIFLIPHGLIFLKLLCLDQPIYPFLLVHLYF